MADVRYVAWVAPESSSGTPASAPNATDVPIGTAWLWEVNVRIPPGHAGLTGIAMVDSNQFIVPYALAGQAWLIGDDDNLTFDVAQEIGSNVTLLTYNTDTVYDHGWQVRLVYTPMTLKGASDQVIVTPDVATWLAELEAESS